MIELLIAKGAFINRNVCNHLALLRNDYGMLIEMLQKEIYSRLLSFVGHELILVLVMTWSS